MEQSENQPQIKKKRISVLAIISMLFLVPILRFFVCDYVRTYPPSRMSIEELSYIIIPGLAAIVLGVISIFIIRKKKETISGMPFAIIGIALGTVIIFGGIACFVDSAYSCSRERFMRHALPLHILGEALEMYDNQKGTYPPPDKWCDLIRPYIYDEKTFICEVASYINKDKGPCHYAINPNCKPNSSADIVLLFETKGGWNQFGGVELITADNHDGRGGYVLFRGGQIKFVKKKDFGKLKWKDEKQQGDKK